MKASEIRRRLDEAHRMWCDIHAQVEIVDMRIRAIVPGWFPGRDEVPRLVEEALAFIAKETLEGK